MNVRKSVKLIVSAILLAALMSALCVNIFAGNDMIAPTWNSILSVTVDLNFDGNEGCASGEAIQKSTATAIDAYLYVYKLVEDEWVYVDGWYDLSFDGVLEMDKTFTGVSGVTYKAELIVTAYTGGFGKNPEKTTVERIKVCP